MRILHYSDLHIGVENYGRIDPATGLSTRLLDFLATLDELVVYALTQDIDLVLFAGDAYKGRDPSQTQQREFARRLQRLSSTGIPVFLLVGNHDLPNAVGRATAIEIFHTLQVPNLIVGDHLGTYHVTTPKGPLQIVALPWPRRATLLTREESRGLSIEDITKEIERRLTDGLNREIERLDPTLPAVLTGHVTINGATNSSEQSMMLGRDHVLFLSAIHSPALDYVALGHIHKHQVLAQHPMVVYSGSLQRVDFSEENDTKGFCVIELEPSASQGQRLKSFEFCPVKARPFLTIDVQVPPDDPDTTATVVQAIKRHHLAEAIIRLNIQLPNEATAAALEEKALRDALEGAHYVAAINRHVEGQRRTRIPSDLVEGLSPLEALRHYLESTNKDEQHIQQLLGVAEQLMSQETAPP